MGISNSDRIEFTNRPMNIALKDYSDLLRTYLRPQKGRVLLLGGLLLTNIGLQLITPQIMRRFIDTVMAGGALELLTRLAMLFIAVALFQQVVSVLATYMSENVGWTATNALRGDLADHCLRLDMAFHNAHTPGEMIERIDGDVTALSNFFSRFVIQVFGNGLLMLGVLALLFREDWRVGSALAAFTLLALYIMARFRNVAVPYWAGERQASAELFGFLEERLAGSEDIRANGAKDYVMRRFFGLMRTLLQRSLRAGLIVNLLLNTMWTLFALGTALAFATGAYLFFGGAITLGTVYLIFQYTNMLERPISEITRQIEDLQKAGAGFVRVQELRRVQSRIPDIGAAGETATLEAAPARALAVEFENVTFGYNDSTPPASASAPTGTSTDGKPGPTNEQPHPAAAIQHEIVLHDLSFRLAPGTVLGLLGRTGSGKTSLTRLLFRLWDPDNGAIRIAAAEPGGEFSAALSDIRSLPIQDLRRQIGMITQNIQLFNASVRDNLTLFDPAIRDETIIQVLHELGLENWFKSLPNELDTVLESGGGGLSAGEAQLLAFTRIFLRDPGLVILDEASSRLDPATEHLIERAVDRLVQGRTAIIVAHRLGTVQRADEIMILDQGRVIEHGPRQALANDSNSRFHALLQTGLEEVLV